MSSVEPTIDGAPARLAAELELLKREQFRTRAALEALEERLLARLEGTADERRAELEAEAARLRLEGAALAKRDVLWRERAIAFFKALENGLGAPGLDAKYRRAIEKTLADFRRLVAPIGLDLIAPEAGSPFDERAHRAIGAAGAPGLPDGVVARCAAWGYRVGDEIVAPAEVLLADAGAAPLEERGLETPDAARDDAGNAAGDDARDDAAKDVGNDAAAAERSAARRFAAGAAWRDPRWAAIAVLAAAAAWFAARPARLAPAASSAERTPAAAIAPATPAAANAEARPIARGRDGWAVHVVRPGESLWSIARDAYGDGSLHGLVAAANPGLPAGLPPGTRLRLPGASIKESQR